MPYHHRRPPGNPVAPRRSEVDSSSSTSSGEDAGRRESWQAEEDSNHLPNEHSAGAKGKAKADSDEDAQGVPSQGRAVSEAVSLGFGGLSLGDNTRMAIESWAENPDLEAGFLTQYQDLFNTEQDFTFLLAAVHYELQGDLELKKACSRIYLLVRKYKRLTSREKREFLETLTDEDGIYQQNGTFKELLGEIQQVAGPRNRNAYVPDDTSIPWSVEQWTFSPPRNRHHRQSVHSQSLPSVEEGRQGEPIPTFMTPLHEDFIVRNSSFFCTGRVFMTLWHENATTGNRYLRGKGALGTSTISGIHNQRVFSHIRRFAVVRECHGFSWVIGVNTYRGQGLKRPGLNNGDIQAHAIIHMAHTSPVRLQGEPVMRKRSIMVDGGEDRKLAPSSRIRFDKVYNFEHNVKVKDVGVISARSMPFFRQYWRDEVGAASQAAAAPRQSSAPS
ncbi:hypothetical protein PV08_03646 [Exophiala spinifera]|uniref:DUF6590 domain-containing protein n=1 Tax=Exophiala spinifera TaxID=91928 RepID=A0A0D1YVN7_9EURO|nr:uncharacterized protein PV08_03646 [Exophiala spinifera]KIW19351.1 hypothetical protein PV08_03646 [Exophiala spinifera]